MKRCANCKASDIEVGEGGAPSKCARCGCKRFVDAPATETPAPAPDAPACSPEKAKALFANIHAAIDQANDTPKN